MPRMTGSCGVATFRRRCRWASSRWSCWKLLVSRSVYWRRVALTDGGTGLLSSLTRQLQHKHFSMLTMASRYQSCMCQDIVFKLDPSSRSTHRWLFHRLCLDHSLHRRHRLQHCRRPRRRRLRQHCSLKSSRLIIHPRRLNCCRLLGQHCRLAAHR